jgi:hypothetical protein
MRGSQDPGTDLAGVHSGVICARQAHGRTGSPALARDEEELKLSLASPFLVYFSLVQTA